MKAIHLLGPERFETDENYLEPSPPEPDEVVIRVRAVGICGSDLHLYKAGHIGSIGQGKTVVPGHEFMGEVVAVGSAATDGFNNPLDVGLRVAVEPHLACHRCEWCERGDPNLCPHHTFIGLPGSDGALRERLKVAARNCFPIPDSISNAAGALLEPLGVAIHALDLSPRPLARSVAVIGAGPIGLMILRLCHLAGAAQLVAIDPNPSRLALAEKWGATHAIQGKAEENLPDAMNQVNRRGFDLVFECAWVGDALAAAVELATPGGHIMLVGIPEANDCVVPHSLARRKGLTLVFVRRMKHTYPRAISLAAGPNPAIRLDEMVSHRSSLDETATVFAMNAAYEDNVVKVVIEP